ncbi:hypothetical protein B0T24DRAFT_620367 [Lasiosphaeria ovina]|uniref:Uncharacterized protein n=1 Tax=Lasiosphaeria ovina TaxID=92902 RepID=A0AAE0KI60_9PEZI|nr:hypothetical protein B0T24DRAFT_620367 [Lasiosphaeria ovina]
MSFLTEAAARRVATLGVPRAMAASAPRASFSSSVTMQKSVMDTAKDTLKTVDRAVSDKLVDGIDIATNVSAKVKEATEQVRQGSAADTASGLQRKAQGAASELAGKTKSAAGQTEGSAASAAGQAKGTANEWAGKAQGKADEVAGKTSGAASKAAGKAKGAAEEAKRGL